MSLRTRRLGLLAAAVAVLAVLPASAGAADRTIAPLAAPTPVRAWNGVAVLSVYDGETKTYRLATSVDEGPLEALPVAPAAAPFDADVGPDSAGHAAIVYARCATVGNPTFSKPASGCDLYRYSLATRREDAIRNANSVEGSEAAPTIWKGRIAWARTYARGNPVVYTRALTASHAVRSDRLPGVPQRRCESPGPCARTTYDGRVDELELYGRRLALNVTYFHKNMGGICGEREVRLDDVERASAAQVADTICGLSGQTWLGPSFVAGRLLFARICPGDPGGCGNHDAVAYRYRLSTRRTETVPSLSFVQGFAALGVDRALEVRSPAGATGRCQGDVPPGPPSGCALVLVDPLRFG